MAGIRERKKSETRKAIQAAAVKLFAEKSFEKTSIEDIAKEAGIGKTTVYGYFSNKNDIFIDYCDEELDQAFASLQTTESNEKTLRNRLVDFFMIKFSFVIKDQEFGRQMLRAMVFPSEINEKAKIHDQRYFDILEGFFINAREKGEIAQSHELFTLSVHFYSLYLGLLAGWYTGYLNTLQEAEEAMKSLFAQAIEGIKNEISL
ncbi:MAG: TetR/AcrR family transcriptional regulator [Desulfuromusa sp.]|jgi:AcrR family transcriptional regulator|nr:TetR/AcrR family transcriptional regulator [Desulfuromusa sp.]